MVEELGLKEFEDPLTTSEGPDMFSAFECLHLGVTVVLEMQGLY